MFAGANLAKLPPSAAPRDGYTTFAGGLDTQDMSLTAKPGALRESKNYEACIGGGYQDLRGYERFDGRTRPSTAVWAWIGVDITGSIVAGDTITGGTSGATGVVIAVAEFSLAPGFFYVAFTKATGTFVLGEDLEVSAVVEGEAISAPTPAINLPEDDETKAQYRNLAADVYRADIAAVPGESNVLGVFMLAGTKYALRKKTGVSFVGLYQESAAGWVEVTFGEEVAFTSGGGAYEIAEGDTITGNTSAATATIERIQITAGTLGGGDAVGWLTLSGVTGTFQSETLNVGANLDVATIPGDSAAITLASGGGQLDWDVSNFANPASGDRVYAADGFNNGWEFDGTVLVKIRTGMNPDRPRHAYVHNKQLFFSFEASAQHSAPGDPMVWNAILGASEIATGSTITGFLTLPGDAGNASLLIASRQKLHILYGNNVSDWNLVPYREEVGAVRWTLQQMNSPIFLDDQGLMDLRAVQEFGNFAHAALSDHVREQVLAIKPSIQGSCVVRAKNQYRLFHSTGNGLYVTIDGRRRPELMPVSLGKTPTCFCSAENASGDEEVYFGASDGFVYQMERGTSFDGAAIDAVMRFHFDASKAPEREKTYYAPATLEGQGTSRTTELANSIGSGFAKVDFSYELNHGDTEVKQVTDAVTRVQTAEVVFNDVVLNAGAGVKYARVSGLDVRGAGRNIGWIIAKNSDYYDPVRWTGIHFRYLPTVQSRG